jgi:SIR2-like domain
MTSEYDVPPGSGANGLRDETWETLVETIGARACTPFLGAGVAMPHLPGGAQLASWLADTYEYPLDDRSNLARVAQYVASRYQPPFVKRKVCDHLKAAQGVAAGVLGDEIPENYRLLAALDLPLYVTTNYDDYLQLALERRRSVEEVHVEICRWNDRLVRSLPPYSRRSPTHTNPLVFHLHGHSSEPTSLLITEDDYIDFTVSLALRTDDPVIPFSVRLALGDTNLLFIGYSLEDWNFRVLLRYIMKQQQVQQHDYPTSLSIQLPSQNVPPERRARAEEFLEAYLKTSASIDVYWGDANQFLKELRNKIATAASARRAS